MRAALCVLLLAGAAVAGPALTLPKEVAGEAGDFIPVKADTPGKSVRFVALDPGLRVFPGGLLADPRATVVTAPTPGRYRLLAYTGDAEGPSDPVVTTVVVGGAPPVPPPPGPGPAPPGPETPLARDLRAALQADPATPADRAKHAAGLAAVYREMAARVPTADLKTAGDLLKALRAAVSSLVPADALKGVRTRIGQEVGAALPAEPDAPLDAPTRAKAAEVFARVAQALEVATR